MSYQPDRHIRVNAKIPREMLFFAGPCHLLLENDPYVRDINAALRSRVRRLVVIFLIRKRSVWLTLSEICRGTGKSTNQVIGAVRGTVGEYEPKYSLLTLRIVQQKEILTSSRRKQKLYKLADTNEETFKLIESILDKYKKEGEL